MSVLKQIKFGSTSTPIAKSVVAINSESTKALSVVATNDQLTDNADPTYTIALAVDGKTITKTGNDGLATALQLKYHAAVTEGTPKGAYIALEDNTGASISGSEIPVADIIGNGMLKFASYSETTGVLTLTFATASGTDTTVQIDLGKLFDIDDIIINSTDGSANYLSFDLANPAAETGQAVLSVKLADVTYTATVPGTSEAKLTVDTTNGKMLAADDAIPAIKSYVDDVLENASTTLAVTAEGDDYVSASVDAATDNKHVIVKSNVQELTATAGTPGQYGTDGSQTTASVAGTLSGTANSLADGADIAEKVKTYVDGAIAIEAARSDAKNKADIAALDFTDTPVDSQYVTKVDEADGVVSVARADVSAAKLNNYTKGTTELPLAAADTINEAFSKIEVSIEKNEKTTATALNDLNSKIGAMDKAESAVAGQVVTTVSEADGVVSETKAYVKDLQLGGYAKDASAKSPIGGTDTINTALSKLENAIDAATTKVVEGTDAGNNLEISSATSETDSSTTYTINLTDVASAQGLAAEVTRAQNAETAIDGAVGLTKAASGEGRTYANNGEYIGKGQTNTVTSDIKALDTKLKEVADGLAAVQYEVSGTTLVFYGISEKTNA